MNNKEFIKDVEDYIDALATTASYTQDKDQVQQLRELLYVEALGILKKKQLAKRAQRLADQQLAQMRKEKRLRLREATRETPEHPRELTIEPETHRTNRVIA
jgi:hypothetical protein